MEPPNSSFLEDEPLPTIYNLETIEQIEALTVPIRYHMILLLTEKAMTSAQLARALGMTRQRAYYHLKVLEKNGLVHLVGERLAGELLEKYYRAYGFIHSYRALVEHFSQTQPQAEINRLMIAVNQFVLTLVNDARQSVLQKDFQEHFEWSYQFDSPLLLTREQAHCLRTEIIEMCRRYLEIDHENRSKEGFTDMLRVRNSIFLSPVSQSFLDALGSTQATSSEIFPEETSL